MLVMLQLLWPRVECGSSSGERFSSDATVLSAVMFRLDISLISNLKTVEEHFDC